MLHINAGDGQALTILWLIGMAILLFSLTEDLWLIAQKRRQPPSDKDKPQRPGPPPEEKKDDDGWMV